MYHTLTGLLSPKSGVKLRNMSGPVGIVNHLEYLRQNRIQKAPLVHRLYQCQLGDPQPLPIPVLDGGHMLFATIEKLRGKPLPLAFLERTQVLFVVLLFSFMLYVHFLRRSAALPLVSHGFVGVLLLRLAISPRPAKNASCPDRKRSYRRVPSGTGAINDHDRYARRSGNRPSND